MSKVAKGFLTEQTLNEIRGKVMVGHATTQEILTVYGHLDAIESVLDGCDMDDIFGTKGWRHYFGLPDDK